MLNLQDLSVSELQAYCDGLKEAINLIKPLRTVTDDEFINIVSRYILAQKIIEKRFAEMEQ